MTKVSPRRIPRLILFEKYRSRKKLSVPYTSLIVWIITNIIALLGLNKKFMKNSKIPLDTIYLAWHSISQKEVIDMDTQLKRGLLDILVLAAIKGEDSYGYKIIKDIKPYMTISESTLYPILRRLEEAGCLTVRSAEHNGRLRKYYHLTDAGKKKLQDFAEEWKEIMEIYEYVVREGKDNE